ncbi:hypothetical protein KKG58_01760 [Patescibacteria group bacterium]|nr:hypothetical protein [Patescibacteria group bacterium]
MTGPVISTLVGALFILAIACGKMLIKDGSPGSSVIVGFLACGGCIFLDIVDPFPKTWGIIVAIDVAVVFFLTLRSVWAIFQKPIESICY